MIFGDNHTQHKIIQALRTTLSLLGETNAVDLNSGLGDLNSMKERISKRLAAIDADPYLRGIVGSWGDTLEASHVLDLLNDWNRAEEIERAA